MDELEALIGKSVNDIDSEILTALESVGFKVAVLAYRYKNCGVRYPSDSFKLAEIDYNDLISFDNLLSFEKLFIFWHFNDIITDFEIYDISDDMNILKKDYDLIKAKIDNGHAHDIRSGDTEFLGAKRLNETISINGRKANKREFVLKKKYLQRILNQISFSLSGFQKI